MDRTIGLLGVATYLPPDTRTNDWWPRAMVDRWQQLRSGPPTLAPSELTDAMSRVLAAMAEHAFDPFHGVIERRVMSDGMTAADMEAEAAERAIANAQIERSEIDVLLTHTAV